MRTILDMQMSGYPKKLCRQMRKICRCRIREMKKDRLRDKQIERAGIKPGPPMED